MRLYKVLDNMKSCHGGNHIWKANEWVKVEGELVPCRRGIHLCREQDLIEWLGPEIWAVEYRGDDFIIDDNKVVVREARITTKYENWNETTARLIACDFAEKVVHIGDYDPRIAEVIRVSRLFAQGQATKDELAAVRNAARNAARAAWNAADAAWNAADAARNAAWAARDAAWAARDAADAARRAARDAAWAARDAAWNAAWAARRAARDAAWAARDEMRQWQTKQLMALLLK